MKKHMNSLHMVGNYMCKGKTLPHFSQNLPIISTRIDNIYQISSTKSINNTGAASEHST